MDGDRDRKSTSPSNYYTESFDTHPRIKQEKEWEGKEFSFYDHYSHDQETTSESLSSRNNHSNHSNSIMSSGDGHDGQAGNSYSSSPYHSETKYLDPNHFPTNRPPTPPSCDNQMSDHDLNVIMEIEREKRLMGHRKPTQFYPNNSQIKLEPLDHYPSEEMSSYGTGVIPGISFLSSSASSHHPSETQKSGNRSRKSGNLGVLTTSQAKKGNAASNATLNKVRKCVTCKRVFSLQVLLKRHIKSHFRIRRSSRSDSLHQTPSKKGFCSKRHRPLKSRHNVIKCSSSLRKLFRNGHLKNVCKTRAGQTSSHSSCFVCQKWFSYKSVFRLHMLKSHTIPEKLPNMLNNSFSTPSKLAVHPTIVPSRNNNQNQGGSRTTKEKKYKCPLCEKSFTQSGKLSNHKKKHTGEKPFHCSVCGKDFALKDHLNIHIKIHTGEKPYPCTLCDKAFRQGGHLRMHMQTHTGVKPHKCIYCDKAFSQKGSLMSHQRIHTGEKLQHQCTLCDKSFRDSTKLNNHVRTHTGEKPFHCSLCDKAFSQSGDLVRHMRTHTGEKPYVCNVCNKNFSEGSNLNKHMRTHTGYKPHECSVCHKSFGEGSTLKNHMRIHSGEKPYQCSVCLKDFIQSSDLYKHMRTHTGEKPHKCSICKKAFTESSTLRKHLKTHRRDDGKEASGGGGSQRGRGSHSQPERIKSHGKMEDRDIDFDVFRANNVNAECASPQNVTFDEVETQDINFSASSADGDAGTHARVGAFNPENVDYHSARSQNVNLEYRDINYGHNNVNFSSNSSIQTDDASFDIF